MTSTSGPIRASSLQAEVPVVHTSLPSVSSYSRNASPAPEIRSFSAADVRPTSPSSNRRGRARYRSLSRPPVKSGTMNLKQLTCHYWRTGQCCHSSQDCMYSHYDTGHYADAPRSVIPGQPPVAGKNAERKFREVETHRTGLRLGDARNKHSRSTSSLANLTTIDNHPFSAPPGGVFNTSRPSTPGGLMLRSPAHPSYHTQSVFPIVPSSSLHYATTNADQLEGEVKFFRTLVEQGGKEKEVMVRTIEDLQVENRSLKAESESNKAEHKRLVEERDALRSTLNLLQQQQQQRGTVSNTMSGSTTPVATLRRSGTSSSFADFGAIGMRRFGSGGNLDPNGS